MTGTFLTKLDLEFLLTDDERNAKLTSPLVFRSAKGPTYTVPAGFTTDLASIPQFVQAVTGKWDKHALGAVLHDYLYFTGMVPRQEADRLFLEGMVSCGVKVWLRSCMWMCVRAAGWQFYKKPRIEKDATPMALTISNGRIKDVKYVPAHSFSSDCKITPTLIVLHDTAGSLRPFSSVEWFKSAECKTSAHIVIERDGTIVQMVPLDRKAYHAGQSSWNGKVFCNSFAIGIEIVNPGHLGADGCARDDNGKVFYKPGANDKIERKATADHGDHYWLHYTPAQIQSIKNCCQAICATYSDVNEIVTHYQISPRRKIDPSPVLPLEDIRAFAFGHHTTDDVDVKPVDAVIEQTPATMLQSTTGNTAGVLGAGGSMSAATEISQAVAKIQSAGEPFSIGGLALNLCASPTFLIGMMTVAGAAYIWFERRKKLIQHGI